MKDNKILHVGTWSSRCGVCGRGAFPNEKTHAKEAGYSKNRGSGCGAEWTHIASDYCLNGEEKKICEEMRPDLIYI